MRYTLKEARGFWYTFFFCCGLAIGSFTVTMVLEHLVYNKYYAAGLEAGKSEEFIKIERDVYIKKR